MIRMPSVLLLLSVPIFVASSFADDDSVKAKLDTAKAQFETEVEKFNKIVTDWLDKREETARKDGNKKLVDQIKAEKGSFEERGELPKTIPASIKQKLSTARRTLETAYGAALKAYTREKKDDEASAIDKELKEFQEDSTAVATRNETRFFNGEDLAGWKGLRGLWSVKDGAIVGSTPPDGINFNTCLCSARQYDDFEMTCKVKLVGPSTANSGIQIRSEIIDVDKYLCHGPQCDIGQTCWGSLYNEGGAMLHEADKILITRVLKTNDFNELFVRCVGNRVVIKLNGHPTVDNEIPNLPPRGIIGWQLHGGKGFGLVIKDIEFKELPAAK